MYFMLSELRRDLTRLGDEQVWHIDDYHEMKASASVLAVEGPGQGHAEPEGLTSLDTTEADGQNAKELESLEAVNDAESACQHAHSEYQLAACKCSWLQVPILISLCNSPPTRTMLRKLGANGSKPATFVERVVMISVMISALASIFFVVIKPLWQLLGLLFAGIMKINQLRKVKSGAGTTKQTTTPPKTSEYAEVMENAVEPQHKLEDMKTFQDFQAGQGTEGKITSITVSPEVEQMRRLLNKLDEKESEVS